MPTPPDHAELLRRADYPVPDGAALSDAERQIVTRFGYWMEALTVGAIAPATDEQERFVRAARGQELPVSAFEVAWVKARPPAGGVSQSALTATARELEATRVTAMAAQQEYAFRQLDILAKVQPEMDALDAELLPRLKSLQAEVSRLEAVLKDGVRLTQKSFWHRGIRVTYQKGRVSFESKAMQEYARTNPDVNRFRKVSQPIVILRYVSPDEKTPDPPADETT